MNPLSGGGKSGIIEGEGKMDRSISALMARIQEIQSRIREIQGMTSRGLPSASGVGGPESAVPPAVPSLTDGTEAVDAASSKNEFSALLDEALTLLGREGTTDSPEAGDVSGAMDLMSSALNSLSSLTGTDEEEESGILMSRENLSRLTDLERVLRGTLDDSTFGK